MTSAITTASYQSAYSTNSGALALETGDSGSTDFAISFGAEGEMSGTATPGPNGQVSFSNMQMLCVAPTSAMQSDSSSSTGLGGLLANLENAIGKYAAQPNLTGAQNIRKYYFRCAGAFSAIKF